MKTLRLLSSIVIALAAVMVVCSHAMAAPDLLILRGTFSWTPERIEDGAMITVNYMVANTGDTTADSFHVGLRVGDTIVARNLHTGLEPMRNQGGVFMWRAACTEATEWAVVADCDTEVTEADETNNTYTNEAFACYIPPPPPNLRLDDIIIQKSGSQTDISADAAYTYALNVYADDARADNVRVRAGIVRGAVIYDHTFPTIPAGDWRRITFKYMMPVGLHTMYVEVDPEDTIEESNEEDNRVTKRVNAAGPEGSAVAPDTSPAETVVTFNLKPKVTNKAAIEGRTFDRGETIYVEGLVDVKGDPKVRSVKVIVFLFPPDPQPALRKEKTVSIRPNSTAPFRLSWILENSGSNSITVSVSEVAGETSTSDNHLRAMRFTVGPIGHAGSPGSKKK